MKIGVMLRHFDQHGGGVKVYTHSLLREMLTLNTEHEFVLIYQSPKSVGSYSDKDHVREIAIKMPNVFLWDQVAVRWVEKREKLDLVFNPKLSIPLTAKCKTVFVSHGLNWAVLSLPKPWKDRMSHKYLMPRYAKKSRKVIAVSETTREHFIKFLNKAPEDVHTVYLGIDDRFREKLSQEKLNEIKKQYKLPDKYLFYCGQIYPAKNFGRLVQAYAKVGPRLGIPLVVAGTVAKDHIKNCGPQVALIDELGISDWVLRPGWIEREDLPAFYQMAEALLLPSLYEACPAPPIEAMASGCPVVTANRYGTKDVSGGAAYLVDPEDSESIAEGIERVLTDDILRNDLIRKGYEREKYFTWERCAEETLRVLENAVK